MAGTFGDGGMALRKKPTKNLVPMLLKAFEILEAFRERRDGLTYMELVERYPRISKVSIYRILCSLEALGYLLKDDRSGKYELGTKFIELGKITEKRQDILRIALPYMERVLRKFGENVNLVKIESGELIYFATLEGNHPLRVTEMPSRRLAIHCSAVGKAILARLPEAEREETIGNLTLARLTPNTITSRRLLRQELEGIRVKGFALDNEENLIGVRCVGVPVVNAEGYPVAAMSVTGPTLRITQAKAGEIGPYLVSIVEELSRAHFGYSQPTQEMALRGSRRKH